jgi:hypothetical protein
VSGAAQALRKNGVVEPRAPGRKVSDQFTAPLRRGHYRELHQPGEERRWWREGNIDREPIALWRRSRAKRGFEEHPRAADPRPTDPPAPEPPLD